MKKLNTIQKRENLNEVYAVDEIGPGGANHKYAVLPKGEEEERLITTYQPICEIQFQKGPRKDENSQHGVIDSDLLEIVRDRLKAFQDGPFSSDYNSYALKHVDLALMYLNRRVEDRIQRNVLGKNEK